MSENFEAKDLLGDPLRPLPDKRGRRKLRFPDQVYENVEILAAGNLTQQEIADATGITVPTLTKYFRKELDGALGRQKARVLSQLAAAADKGNVAAMRTLNAEIDKRRAEVALRARERPSSEPRKGVKDVRQEAAGKVAAAGGKFAPPPAPRLVIDNP